MLSFKKHSIPPTYSDIVLKKDKITRKSIDCQFVLSLIASDSCPVSSILQKSLPGRHPTQAGSTSGLTHSQEAAVDLRATEPDRSVI